MPIYFLVTLLVFGDFALAEEQQVAEGARQKDFKTLKLLKNVVIHHKLIQDASRIRKIERLFITVRTTENTFSHYVSAKDFDLKTLEVLDNNEKSLRLLKQYKNSLRLSIVITGKSECMISVDEKCYQIQIPDLTMVVRPSSIENINDLPIETLIDELNKELRALK